MYLLINYNFLCRTRLTLKKAGVELELVPPPSKVNNLIFGRTWVDSPGEMVLTNLTTKDKVVLYFQPCGWFGYESITTTYLFCNFGASDKLHCLYFKWPCVEYR